MGLSMIQRLGFAPFQEVLVGPGQVSLSLSSPALIASWVGMKVANLWARPEAPQATPPSSRDPG